eukprot:1196299-Prorocentrum_minimum.AAC.7
MKGMVSLPVDERSKRALQLLRRSAGAPCGLVALRVWRCSFCASENHLRVPKTSKTFHGAVRVLEGLVLFKIFTSPWGGTVWVSFKPRVRVLASIGIRARQPAAPRSLLIRRCDGIRNGIRGGYGTRGVSSV